ncbi:MAG: hypothetical protein JW771_04640 [Candidatus Thermoplasmatota archaeon]|nr:hypothetical protein [Candidatus Thermoplasmatota archaeon]
MAGSLVDILIFAPLAPILGVLLLWFIQLLFIESQKLLLAKIRPKHEPLCRFTNFLGILFQTICHALGYTVTRSGIAKFYVSVDYGKVSPKKEREGVFEWISNSFLFLGPFFIPAFLLLICLYLFTSGGFEVATPPELTALQYTFTEQIVTFGRSLHIFTQHFFGFLATIDLLHPGHLGFLLLLLFLGLGIRPSYIGEKRQEKIDMLYDLKNIWSHIIHRPLYVILLFLLAYVLFYISLALNQQWYVGLFAIFGWLSIIAIVSLVVTHLLLLMIKTTDKIQGHKKLLPYITLPLAYILMRTLFLFIPTEWDKSISLITMIGCTIIVLFLLVRKKKKKKTNTFKAKIDMKALPSIEDETDEPGGAIR